MATTTLLNPSNCDHNQMTEPSFSDLEKASYLVSAELAKKNRKAKDNESHFGNVLDASQVQVYVGPPVPGSRSECKFVLARKGSYDPNQSSIYNPIKTVAPPLSVAFPGSLVGVGSLNLKDKFIPQEFIGATRNVVLSTRNNKVALDEFSKLFPNYHFLVNDQKDFINKLNKFIDDVIDIMYDDPNILKKYKDGFRKDVMSESENPSMEEIERKTRIKFRNKFSKPIRKDPKNPGEWVITFVDRPISNREGGDKMGKQKFGPEKVVQEFENLVGNKIMPVKCLNVEETIRLMRSKGKNVAEELAKISKQYEQGTDIDDQDNTHVYYTLSDLKSRQAKTQCLQAYAMKYIMTNDTSDYAWNPIKITAPNDAPYGLPPYVPLVHSGFLMTVIFKIRLFAAAGHYGMQLTFVSGRNCTTTKVSNFSAIDYEPTLAPSASYNFDFSQVLNPVEGDTHADESTTLDSLISDDGKLRENVTLDQVIQFVQDEKNIITDAEVQRVSELIKCMEDDYKRKRPSADGENHTSINLSDDENVDGPPRKRAK